jgi:hypothetical protein
MAFEDLRWMEWIIHKRLSRWHGRGERFAVRPVAEPCGWEEFLSRSQTGDMAGCTPWRLGTYDHHLVRMRRLAEKGRHFDAECACGFVLHGGPGLTLIGSAPIRG